MKNKKIKTNRKREETVSKGTMTETRKWRLEVDIEKLLTYKTLYKIIWKTPTSQKKFHLEGSFPSVRQ
jgi:hypothetical protein